MSDDLAQRAQGKAPRQEGTLALGGPSEATLSELALAALRIAVQVFARDGRSLLVNALYVQRMGAPPPSDYKLFRDDALIAAGVLPLFARAFAGERVSVPRLGLSHRHSEARASTFSAELAPLPTASGEVEQRRRQPPARRGRLRRRARATGPGRAVSEVPPGLGSPQPAMRVIKSGQPELLREVDDAAITEHTVNAEHFALMQRLSLRSHLAVPLSIGGRALGAISLGFVGSPLSHQRRAAGRGASKPRGGW